jgi:hypothetical protein
MTGNGSYMFIPPIKMADDWEMVYEMVLPTLRIMINNIHRAIFVGKTIISYIYVAIF